MTLTDVPIEVSTIPPPSIRGGAARPWNSALAVEDTLLTASPAPSLVIDQTTLVLRRDLGPTAWVVFEALLLESTPTTRAQVRVASTSIRSLAGSLGLAKDTVARALGRLRRAGLVTAMQTRTVAGTFATGSYRLTVPDSITLTVTHTNRAAPSPSRRASVSQLALVLDS
jgi:DNA-binding transcriptional ArsR family regulator